MQRPPRLAALFFFMNGNRNSSVYNRNSIGGEARMKHPEIYHDGVGR
jgi:hypothetical protein